MEVMLYAFTKRGRGFAKSLAVEAMPSAFTIRKRPAAGSLAVEALPSACTIRKRPNARSLAAGALLYASLMEGRRLHAVSVTILLVRLNLVCSKVTSLQVPDRFRGTCEVITQTIQRL